MTMQSSYSAQEENWQNVVAHENPQVENNGTTETERDMHRESAPRRKSLRGFAAMDGEKQKAIASMGGRAAHQQGVAHEFSSEEARMAGKKGGEAVSRNREHMAAIGKKGGEAAHGRRRQRQEAQQHSGAVQS
ncbi:KGG domain-containing protein [Chitinophaga japonensis]|uniref:Stress-induced acidophilic repeat protein n=1 Tax=Chitinophaga japonensis TaxID=104662 RepID=A0A562T6N8_CHIJA|nr:KGG domain-containing protein [Chitinophaga japonensis]TWI89209.1 hypothetical protein LX66_3303 [Chitinophaga japonensis]